MEQQAETGEVLEEFKKAKSDGRQPVCCYCHKPLEIGQFYSVYVQWTWNDKEKVTSKRNQTGTVTRLSAMPARHKTGISQTMI